MFQNEVIVCHLRFIVVTVSPLVMAASALLIITCIMVVVLTLFVLIIRVRVALFVTTVAIIVMTLLRVSRHDQSLEVCLEAVNFKTCRLRGNRLDQAIEGSHQNGSMERESKLTIIGTLKSDIDFCNVVRVASSCCCSP